MDIDVLNVRCFIKFVSHAKLVTETYVLYDAVLARRKSTSRARHFNRASMSLSLIGIVLGFVLYVFLLILVSYSRTWECGVEDTGWNQTLYGRRSTTTTLPEMSSPACYVVGNETACFGFASSFTAEWCSAIGGSFVDVNSSSSATLSSMHVCYHNVCSDYVVNTSCFQYRSALYSNLSLLLMAGLGTCGWLAGLSRGLRQLTAAYNVEDENV